MEVEKLQRYDLVERIAAGGMGEVFRARATGPHGFEKTLAVKRVLPELASDEEFVERFVRECKLSVSLSHANIVQVFDLGRAGKDLFLVMEYIHGTDLARLLLAARMANRSMPVGIALLIVSEAAEGLAYAHGRYGLEGREGNAGIIHCDISPSNLLLSYAGEVKLTDFGVAQLLDHRRRRPAEAHLVMGKWRYMAPEQIRGEAVDARTDLYALGVVLYELLTGRKAFGGEGIKATCDQVLASDVTPVRALRPEVPEEVERFVRRVMAVDPRDRPADAQVFLEEIAALRRALDQTVTALDLGALVRELVPPPPEIVRRGGLGAFLQPMIVERTGDRTGSFVRRRKPAASFVTYADSTNSAAITQWVPAGGTLPGWHRLPLWGKDRKRLGLMAVAVGAGLLLIAMGVGLATGMRMRDGASSSLPERALRGDGQGPAQGQAQGGEDEARPPGAPEAARVERLLPGEAPLPPPVEPIPQQLAALMARPAASGPGAGSAGAGAQEDPERLAGRKQGAAYLDIYVEPWANVVLDGRPLPRPTPLTKVLVKPGAHRLLLSNPILKKSKAVDVTVSQGQTHKVEIYLNEK